MKQFSKDNPKQNNQRFTVVAALGFCVLIGFNSSMSDSINKKMNEIPLVQSEPISNQPNFEFASKQSLGFFDDISDQNWRLLQKMVHEHIDHKYPDNPYTHHPSHDTRKMKYFSSYPAWWQTNYEPEFSCQFEQRVGGNGNGDGPKWVCDPHRIRKIAAERKIKNPDIPGCVIYSIGSNGDFGFETGMQDLLGPGTCEIRIFDPGNYSDKVPEQLVSTYYHQWFYDKQAREEGHIPDPQNQHQGLKDIIKLLGHEDIPMIDVFKIDCEKCEWKTYQDWFDPEIPVIRQILVELHNAPDKKVLDFFTKIKEHGYVRFHKEPNIQFNDGSCLEYAFLKLDKEFFDVTNDSMAES